MEEGKDVTKADDSKTNSKKEDPNSDNHLPKLDDNNSKSDEENNRMRDYDIKDISINADLQGGSEINIDGDKKDGTKHRKKLEIDMLGLNNKCLTYVYSDEK